MHNISIIWAAAKVGHCRMLGVLASAFDLGVVCYH